MPSKSPWKLSKCLLNTWVDLWGLRVWSHLKSSSWQLILQRHTTSELCCAWNGVSGCQIWSSPAPELNRPIPISPDWNSWRTVLSLLTFLFRRKSVWTETRFWFRPFFFARVFTRRGKLWPYKRCWSPPPKFRGPLVFTSALFPRFCGEISTPVKRWPNKYTGRAQWKSLQGFLEVLIFMMYQSQFKGQWKKVPSASLVAADPFANVNG